jgi:hypothetical protein
MQKIYLYYIIPEIKGQAVNDKNKCLLCVLIIKGRRLNLTGQNQINLIINILRIQVNLSEVFNKRWKYGFQQFPLEMEQTSPSNGADFPLKWSRLPPQMEQTSPSSGADFPL